MKKIAYFVSMLLLIGIIIVACKKDDDSTPPGADHTVTGFTPPSGSVGTTVTVKGTEFTNQNIQVKFGVTLATVSGVHVNGTELYTSVPEGAETGKISVTIDGVEVKSTSNFTVTEEVSGPEAIELAETSLEMHTLDTAKFPEITNLDEFENPTISYESDNTEVIYVDAEGNLIALQAGSANITASIGNLNASIEVDVESSIFVGGYIEKNNGEYGVSTVWKNGVAHELSDTNSYATYIAVEGPNLYATHVEYSLDDTRPIKVYKNNTLYGTVGNVDENNRAPKAMQVVGDDVYICGFEKTDGTQYAKYWTNSTETVLSAEGNPAVAHGLFLSNDKLYVAGKEDIDTDIAKYWINGNPAELANTNSVAYDIYVNDIGEIYTAGEKGNIATIWKNTEILHQFEEGNNSNQANSISVHNDNVFATGVDWTTQMGKLWINGQLAYEWPGHGSALTVYNGSIYVAGWKYDAILETNTAVVLEISSEGELIEEKFLSSISGSTYANSIVVK
ncbi:IPT/TIG domain-containing protein [Flagellimonas flava]|uniref:IPT/TIG domain-containing protein n=1 Tax=Flagellimonas flava TaxID=570519 RepID=UPI003D64D4AE